MLSDVVSATLAEGRGGLLGGDTSRRLRWWRLSLACGCEVERECRYDGPNLRRFGGHQRHSRSDVRPHPRRARCEDPTHESNDPSFRCPACGWSTWNREVEQHICPGSNDRGPE